MGGCLTFPSDKREFLKLSKLILKVCFTKVDDDLDELKRKFNDLLKRVENLESVKKDS